MTLDEAIKHAEEVAEEQKKAAKEWHENQVRKCEVIPFAEMDYTYENKCKECAEEHRQLAEWLKELKQYREWLKSFNPDSATECFTAVRKLRSFVGRDINIPTTAMAEGGEE